MDGNIHNWSGRAQLQMQKVVWIVLYKYGVPILCNCNQRADGRILSRSAGLTPAPGLGRGLGAASRVSVHGTRLGPWDTRSLLRALGL